MRESMMDILACPNDKRYPLELFSISRDGDDILEGVLSCPACLRFYVIAEGIPIMLPDDLRDRAQETAFLKRHAGKIPQKITKDAKPWHL